MIEKYITSLEEIKNVRIDSATTLSTWKARAVNIIVRIYGKDSRQEEQINKINYKTYPSISYGTIGGGMHHSGGGNNLEVCKKQAYDLIESFINELKTFGLPEIDDNKNKKIDGINITLNQTQTQKQTINLNIILEALQEELTGKQLKEIQDIIDNDKTVEDKKKGIIETLKSFGKDLATNVIANILTNPNLYKIIE